MEGESRWGEKCHLCKSAILPKSEISVFFQCSERRNLCIRQANASRNEYLLSLASLNGHIKRYRDVDLPLILKVGIETMYMFKVDVLAACDNLSHWSSRSNIVVNILQSCNKLTANKCCSCYLLCVALQLIVEPINSRFVKYGASQQLVITINDITYSDTFKNSLVIHEGNTKQISTMTVTLHPIKLIDVKKNTNEH